MIKIKVFLLIIITFPFAIQAQDLTGTWIGHRGSGYDKLVVIQRGDSLRGYIYEKSFGWCEASFAGLYNNDKKTLKGVGIKMLRQSGGHGLSIYQLEYSTKRGFEELAGSLQPKSGLGRAISFGFGVRMDLRKETKDIDTIAFMRPFVDRDVSDPAQEEKKKDTEFSPVTKLPDTPLVSKPSSTKIEEEKNARISKLVQRIYTNVDSVKIALYDNGEVDQDSVTLFFDEAIILNRYMISDKPMELIIAIPKDGKEHSLDLFAHNLGTIPPNTALIIITAGKKRYELRASYDLNTNARIIFSNEP